MNRLLSYRSREVSEAIEAARKKDSILYFKKYSNQLLERACPVCKSLHSSPCEPYGGGFPVAKCLDCGMLYAPRVLTGAALEDYYVNSQSANLLNDFYRTRPAGSGVNAQRVQLAVDVLTTRYQTVKRPLRILEVGSGNGAFLCELARRMNAINIPLHMIGLDANAFQVQQAVARGLDVRHHIVGEQSLSTLAIEEGLDALFFFELIEHLPDPSGFMREGAAIMAKSGLAVFTTPNVEGFENALTGYNGYRQLAHAMAPPAHINAFGTSNIRLFLYLTGFIGCHIEAKGIFDAAALQAYIESGLPDELTDRHFHELSNINSEAIQFLINFTNGSSTMSVVAKRGAQ